MVTASRRDREGPSKRCRHPCYSRRLPGNSCKHRQEDINGKLVSEFVDLTGVVVRPVRLRFDWQRRNIKNNVVYCPSAGELLVALRTIPTTRNTLIPLYLGWISMKIFT